jgi:hypothetical protein
MTDDKHPYGGLLIDWNFCKTKDTQETGDHRASRTVRGVIPG